MTCAAYHAVHDRFLTSFFYALKVNMWVSFTISNCGKILKEQLLDCQHFDKVGDAVSETADSINDSKVGERESGIEITQITGYTFFSMQYVFSVEIWMFTLEKKSKH